MKAHFVKGNVFAVVFSLSRAFLRGRGGHGWLANRRFAFFLPVVFVLRRGLARQRSRVRAPSSPPLNPRESGFVADLKVAPTRATV